MFANPTTRNSLYLVSVLLIIALLSGAAPLNHSPPSALAQISDDDFDPSPAFEHPLTVAPTANFSADPTSGPPPLQVQFTDESVGNPTGWAWYFGDEAFDEPWTEMTICAEWKERYYHTSVALPDGSIVLMGGDTGSRILGKLNDVWRSTDQGATWTLIGYAGWTKRDGHTSVVLPDGSIVLMGGEDGGTSGTRRNDVWRSTDQGTTWTQMTATAGWTARRGHTSVTLADGSIVLMGGSDGSRRNDVWRSTDQGATWTQMTPAAGWTGRNSHTSVALPDGSIVLMGGYDGARRNDVWRSTDQGTTWTPMTATAGWTPRIGHTSVALPDGNIVLMGGSASLRLNDVWRSTDRGATWAQMTSCASYTARSAHTSVMLPDGSIVLMGGSGGIADVWRSTDQGATWTQMTPAAGWSARTAHTSVALPDGSIVLMGGYDGSNRLNDVWRSTDQGATWTQMTPAAGWSGRSGHSSVALPDGSIILMGGTDGSRRNDVWRSTNQGATWTQMTPAAGWSGRSGHSSVTLPDGSIVLTGGYTGNYSSGVWRSTDQGATWTQMATGVGWKGRSNHTSVALPDGSIVLMGGSYIYNYNEYTLSDVWRSTDQGATWTQMTSSVPYHNHSSVALPDGSIVLALSNHLNVWRLETAGSTEQHPTHTYTEPGTYSVALQVYNADGFDSLRRVAYINVTDSAEPEFIKLFLPLILR